MVDKTEARPQAHTSRAPKESRPRRVPVSGHRDILTVGGKDPAFYYRWVMDTDESGATIEKYLGAGYELVMTNEIDGVGQRRVASDTGQGSVVRQPAGNAGRQGVAQYLYLMKVPMEFYQEDQKAKLDEVAARERGLLNPFEGDEGYYGKIKRETKAVG